MVKYIYLVEMNLTMLTFDIPLATQVSHLWSIYGTRWQNTAHIIAVY